MQYLQSGRSLRAYIGVPVQQPQYWAKVTGVQGKHIRCEGSQLVDPAQINTFIIAYANGEVLDGEQFIFPWPDGIYEAKQVPRVSANIHLSTLSDGERFAHVAHSVSPMRKTDKYYYATTLTNLTQQRIRVVQFAAYTAIGGGVYQLTTITGGYFTDDQFRAWYGLNEREWIEPGESVTDPENYGGSNVLWAYFCRTESGEEFVAGAVAR